MVIEEIYKEIEKCMETLDSWSYTNNSQQLIDLLLLVETDLFRARIKLERYINQ